MPVPLAPIEEMREIAERVGVQFAGIEAQEREIDRLLRMARVLAGHLPGGARGSRCRRINCVNSTTCEHGWHLLVT